MSLETWTIYTLLKDSTWRGVTMKTIQPILALAFKAVALATAALTIVFVVLEIVPVKLDVIFIAIGLLALAIASIIEHKAKT